LKPSAFEPAETHAASGSSHHLLSILAWITALLLLAVAGYIAWQTLVRPTPEQGDVVNPTPASRGSSGVKTAALPEFNQVVLAQTISRLIEPHTTIPDRPTQEVRPYTVQAGDSVFEIAARFDIKPETVLWSNYETLNDNPDLISLGMALNLPSADGVLHRWSAGDTLESVAARYEARVEDILTWSSNQIDLIEQQVQTDALIFIPGGEREFRQWIIPTIPRGPAGVLQSVYGSGVCDSSTGGAFGSGAFIWPAGNHVLSGNDYWSGHLGIDVAAGEGAPIYAADAGVVVFSGWANGGYGNTLMIDHGNGYQTLYAHLSSLAVSCGRSLAQGQILGYSGSTGNSTGPHLHFEVRYQGGFVNPWYVLPAP
jgi:LysM repeat protein